MRSVFLLLLCVFLYSDDVLDFDLIKMPTQKIQDPLVLIISGIQGDEPGGFNATNLFLRHYKILSGEIWIIPNLNKHSILRNHRGIYGDMNRKFNVLDVKDKEYPLIQKIKKIILDERIRVIYHLHDGGGFYRANYIDAMQNPNRWGNCSIIDQERVQGSYYEDLFFLSKQVVENINQNILQDLHRYHIRNTHTATQDKEMEKSLTFFAIKNHKTALANEASKNLPLNQRVYYHLLGIEGMLKSVGVEFERDFELNPKTIYSLMYPKQSMIQIQDSVILPVFGLRAQLSFFPLPKVALSEIQVKSDQYIMGFLKKKNQVLIKYGNKVITTLNPLFIEFSNDLEGVEFEIDGQRQWVKMGSIVGVKNYFSIFANNGAYRVNVIGYQSQDGREDEKKIRLKDFLKHHSIDRKERKYRVEFYDLENRFLGMVVVDFD